MQRSIGLEFPFNLFNEVVCRVKNFAILSISAACLVGLGLIVFGALHSIQFERNCKGYLKHAADANSITLAHQELAKAVRYLEASQMTTGSTHVLYATPECELDFWYQNLSESLTELQSFPKEVDPLTASNQLLKLRESLMDNGEKGTKVTLPPNIHVFPNQFVYRTAGMGCLLGLAAGLMALACSSTCHEKRNCQTVA